MKQAIRRVKRKSEMSLTRWFEENPKDFHTFIKNLRVIRVKVQHSRICLESPDVDKVLKEHFASVSTKERNGAQKDQCGK